MSRSNILALFIPCYNEEKRLKIHAIREYIISQEQLIDFYFINDGSNDRTEALLLEHLVQPFHHSNLISIPENIGKGNALRYGILNQTMCNYKYFGFIDADMDIPFLQVNNLYSNLKDSDNLIAISYRSFDKNSELRNLLSKVFLKISNNILDLNKPLKDSQCGCKLFKNEIITMWDEEFISRWLFDIEIFMRLKNNLTDFENRLLEQKVLELNKSHSSKIKFLDFPLIVKDLIMIKWKYINRT